jgi:hypothetical protein
VNENVRESRAAQIYESESKQKMQTCEDCHPNRSQIFHERIEIQHRSWKVNDDEESHSPPNCPWLLPGRK